MTTLKSKIKKVAKIARTNVHTINTFVHSIEIFCISLIVICLIFLSVVMINDSKFQRIFYLFHTFQNFKRTMEAQCLRLFSNLCFDIGINGLCDNSYKRYSMFYAMVFPQMKDMPLVSDVVYLELLEIMENVKNSFHTFQNDLYRLNIKELNEIYPEGIKELFESTFGNASEEIRQNFID